MRLGYLRSTNQVPEARAQRGHTTIRLRSCRIPKASNIQYREVERLREGTTVTQSEVQEKSRCVTDSSRRERCCFVQPVLTATLLDPQPSGPGRQDIGWGCRKNGPCVRKQRCEHCGLEERPVWQPLCDLAVRSHKQLPSEIFKSRSHGQQQTFHSVLRDQ